MTTTPTTSGTIGIQQIDITSLIEKAVRRCGRLPGSIDPEELNSAQQTLFLMLSEFVNRGIPLWTIEKIIMGLQINQKLLQFPAGTIDLRNVLYRYNVLPSGGQAFSSAGGIAANAFDGTGTTPCIQTAPNGYIYYNFGQQVVIPTVGFLNNQTQTLNPVYEYSNDGINWTFYAQASYAGGMATTFGSGTYNAGQWYWQDVNNPVAAQFFRLRETSGGTLNVLQIVFGQPAREVTISRTNADDYQNLPYKDLVSGDSGGGRPLQYWFDRQIQPQAWLWPESGLLFNTLVCWARRELQDVGSYTNMLEFPTRWLNAIIDNLAKELSYELQGVNPQRIPLLETKAMKSMALAWTEERDDSPVFYAPQIGVYTRMM